MLGEGRRDHILVHPVEVGGDPGRIIALQRPVAPEILERLPPEQQRVGGGVLSTRFFEQVRVVDVGGRGEPSDQHLDRAVEGDVLGDGERAHRAS